MNTPELTNLKLSLKKELGNNVITPVFERLRALIPTHNTGKINTLFLLQREFTIIKELQVRGTYGINDLAVRQATFLENFMAFIDSLDTLDFEMPQASTPSTTPSRKRRKMGSVLYGIPSKMALDEEKECIVRLAFDESILLEDLPLGQDVHVKAIRRIDKRMEVEFVDPNEEKVFSIRSISTPVQTVEEEDYTEWLYFIKPLKEGVHELWLKVMVIILQDGEKIKKDIVLQEKIEVVAHTEEVELGIELKRAGLFFMVGLPAIHGIGETTEAVEATSVTTTSTTNQAVSGSTVGGGKSILSSTLAKVGALIVVIGLLIGSFIFFNAGADDDSANSEASTTTESLTAVQEGQGEEIGNGTSGASRMPAFNPEAFVINPLRDTILYMPTGTSFSIPANTIVNQNDMPLPGLVTVKIREIVKTHEVIASGISMRYYDDKKKEWWLQTAGMFDVQAYYEGKPTKIANGKGIDVTLVSPVGGDYDFWKYDEETENWDNLEKVSRAKRQQFTNTKLKKEIEELKRLTAKRPLPPRNYKPHMYDVNEIDISCCPELKPEDGRNLILTYAGNNPDKALENNEWVNDRRWSKISLKKSAQGNSIYEFTWLGDTIFTTYVSNTRGKEVKQETIARYDSLKKVYEKNLERLKEKQELVERQATFQRSMRIQGFGIYNYDILWDQPDMVDVYAKFNFESINMTKEAANSLELYLVTGDRRVVIKYPVSKWKEFRFSPSSDNQLLAFLPGNKVGVFSQKDFNNAKASIQNAAKANKPYVFDMQILEEEVYNLDDLAQVVINSSDR